MDIRILETLHAQSGLGLVTNVCLLPAQNKSRRDYSAALSLSDHFRLRRISDRHRLKVEHSLPFGFDCFRKLRFLIGRKMVPRLKRDKFLLLWWWTVVVSTIPWLALRLLVLVCKTRNLDWKHLRSNRVSLSVEQ